MSRHAYTGIADPAAQFEALRPLVDRLRGMQQGCKPFGRDYHAIAVALEALDTAAYHFTRRPQFYASAPPTSFGPPRRE